MKRSIISCFYSMLFCVFVSNFLTVDAAKKCSRIISRIPVHKDFDISKFVGTWYTIQRTTWAWGEDTYDSFSIEISKHDDQKFHFSYTGKMGDTCLPVESGVLEQRSRDGSYFLRGSGSKDNHATLIVSFTDYKDMALIYYCYKYRPGSQRQCSKQGMQVEVVSRNEKPAKTDLNQYSKRANNRLCAPLKHLKPTTPGMCKIPDILEAARQRSEGPKSEDMTAAGTNKCAVNNIPVQQSFNSSQLHGLWYEIARTRHSQVNTMESVLNFHRYDDTNGKIYSYYTGTILLPHEEDEEVPCLPAIHGMSIVKAGAKHASDRLGRIGWENSNYPWAPLKVLYADNDYLLFYSCYSGPSEQKCTQNMVEVTLHGRTRYISEEKKETIFSILKDICVMSEELIETKFYANCSNEVTIETDEVKPEDCKLDTMPIFEDYEKSQMEGRWFQFGSISYNKMTSLQGVVMDKKVIGDVEVIRTRIQVFNEDSSCDEYQTTTRDMCVDSPDQIIVLPHGGDGKFVFNKVLYLDNTTLIEYTCAMRTLEGTCDQRGIQFNVYTRTYEGVESTVKDIPIISKLAKSVCLDVEDFVLTTAWCETVTEDISTQTYPDLDSELPTDEYPVQAVEVTAEDISETFSDDCDIDRIATVADIDDYIQEDVYGYWYEIARSTGNAYITNGQAVVAYFTSANNETLNVYYTGLSGEGDEEECSDITHTSLLARCQTDYSGDYLARFNVSENFTSYVPFKVIYTDYSSVLVTYTCQEVTEFGNCSEAGTHIRIWGRNTSLDDDTLSYAYGMCLWACVDPEKEGYFQQTGTENNACFSTLEEYVVENNLTHYYESEEEDDYYQDDFEDHQKDQTHRDQFQLDLEEALMMDDDEFYYDL